MFENFLSGQSNLAETQTESDTSQRLKHQLNQARHLASLWNSQDFQQYLLPHLKAHLDNKWLDPLSFPSQEEFYRAYLQYRAKAVAYAELIQFLSGQEASIRTLEKRLAPKKSSI